MSTCCRQLNITFDGEVLPHHSHFSGLYNMMSSRPVLYRNTILKLYITKDYSENWVVSVYIMSELLIPIFLFFYNYKDFNVSIKTRWVHSRMESTPSCIVTTAKDICKCVRTNADGKCGIGIRLCGKWTTQCISLVKVLSLLPNTFCQS